MLTLAGLTFRIFKHHPWDRISVGGVTHQEWFRGARETLALNNASALEVYPESSVCPDRTSDVDSSEDGPNWIYTGARLLRAKWGAPDDGFLRLPPAMPGPVSQDDVPSIDNEDLVSYETDSRARPT